MQGTREHQISHLSGMPIESAIIGLRNRAKVEEDNCVILHHNDNKAQFTALITEKLQKLLFCSATQSHLYRKISDQSAQRRLRAPRPYLNFDLNLQQAIVFVTVLIHTSSC